MEIKWAFMERFTDVISLEDPKVAYSWHCGREYATKHVHTIECLWIWHNCDLHLNPVPDHWTHIYKGWQPTGVALHTLIAVEPLHIEASVYWPDCCGLHGFIRDGKWEGV